MLSMIDMYNVFQITSRNNIFNYSAIHLVTKIVLVVITF